LQGDSTPQSGATDTASDSNARFLRYCFKGVILKKANLVYSSPKCEKMYRDRLGKVGDKPPLLIDKSYTRETAEAVSTGWPLTQRLYFYQVTSIKYRACGTLNTASPMHTVQPTAHDLETHQSSNCYPPPRLGNQYLL
jgi:hypothetical protein